MNKELKPCPFCGSEKLKVDSKSRDGRMTFSVRCNVCHARGGVTSIDKRVVIRELGYKGLRELEKQAGLKAVEIWNTRKPIDEIAEQLEECSVNYCKEYGYAEDENVLYLPDAIEIVKGGAV